MTSRAISTRLRKRPEERRDEILAAAATIAIDEGLERITLRAVAERLGVRPGLITHYFPAADDLVVRAFARAAEAERERFFPSGGGPLDRLAHFLHHIETGASQPLARLWLNARHLARFRPALNDELEKQDALDRARLVSLIRDGIASGDFGETDAEAAGIRILIAIDGSGSYVNSPGDYTRPVYRHFVADVAEWVLRISPGSLRRAIDARRASPDSS
ncbi:TetR/AcrR family transcriptional regulator [Microbacterium sp. CFH 90308]|uniref:TetR/AcrR family transcriptional regulator n=1 Tax=Microbacterium salsuginis TaxID=2722803 RepID=A0ABX1K7V1_9MICO|nr:TetR/AcrR family transcriptional regulator [Microbacterium sp. CFH 90308]NLP83098.1 TetR/AcrR family transcriptional regulator [Microbacterium sp. CFH 90308]